MAAWITAAVWANGQPVPGAGGSTEKPQEERASHDAATRPPGARNSYWRLRSGLFEVITDAGEPAGRRALARLRRMQEFLGRRSFPFRAYVFATERELRRLRPAPTVRGFYQSGPDRDSVVALASGEDGRVLAHEFVHAALEHSTNRRPLWLEEGTAEYFSTVAFENGRWTVGRPIENHVRLLTRSGWLSAADFFSISKDSPVYDEGAKAGLFYAQSWAVLHLLYAAPGFRERMSAFVAALDEGRPVEEASRRAYGLSAAELLRRARTYVEDRRFPVASLGAEPGEEAEPVTVDRAGPGIVAELALACGKTDYARELYGAEPTATAAGLLALAAGDTAAAEARFAEAVAAGTPEAGAYFELALLRRERKQPYLPLLRQAVTRNPAYAEAWFLLGLDAARREEWEEAVEAYQRATQLLPRQANFWHGLTLALLRSGRRAEAAEAAMRCRVAALTPPEREMAAALAGLLREEAPRPASGPPIVVPDAWDGPQADAVEEAVLEEFQCGERPVMRLRGFGELRILRPRAIRVTGGEAELACGRQERRVRVGYIGATREVVSVEFLR